MLDHRGNICLTFQETVWLVLRMLCYLQPLQQGVRGPVVLYPCQHLVLSTFLILARVASQVWFSVHSSKD